MFMAALERLAGVAEQERAWSHELAACCGSVLKAAGCNDRDAEARVAFFERSIVSARRADHIFDGPAFAFSKQFDRNFRQEFISAGR